MASQPVADELLPFEQRSAAWWHEYKLDALRFYWREIQRDKREFQRLYYEALYTARGDPDATDAEREQAEKDMCNAVGWASHATYQQSKLQQEAEQLKATPAPADDRPSTPPTPPTPPCVPRVVVVARPRERRARRRSRSSSSSGDDPGGSDSDGEGPHDVVRWPGASA